jgi:hypothetical protein
VTDSVGRLAVAAGITVFAGTYPATFRYNLPIRFGRMNDLIGLTLVMTALLRTERLCPSRKIGEI